MLLTNRLNVFQNSTAIETGVSEIHSVAVVAMKTKFEKLKLRFFYFRDDLLRYLLRYSLTLAMEFVGNSC